MTPTRKNGSPEEQQERIVSALAESAAEKGYAATTIEDIARGAGISKRTFYRHFDGKDACYEAAVGSLVAQTEEAMAKASSGAKDRSVGVAGAAKALLAELAAQPEVAKLTFLEPGSSAEGQPPRPMGELVLSPLLEEARGAGGDGPAVPEVAVRAALGAAQALVVDQLIAERGDRLADLLPDLLYISLVPYVGQEEAARRAQGVAKSGGG